MRSKLVGLVLGVTCASGCIFAGGGGVDHKKAEEDAGIQDANSADGTRPDATGPDATADAQNNGQPDIGPADMPPDDGPPTTCGDGALQADETCDPALPETSAGACPTVCDDGVACTADEFVGSAEMCDLACRSTAIEVCQNGDGCCPGDCTPDNDIDCDDTVVCGDGQLAGAETCDPGIGADSAGACPLSPADCAQQQCRSPIVVGSAQNCDAVCAYVDITSCLNGDGCCPAGCDEANDDDCASACGNGAIEPGETCDGNCPTGCDDGDACTSDALTGDASTCDAECTNTAIAACTNGDGCCPSGCDSTTDDDCSASCGDGVVDMGETCDPPGSCPTSCTDGVACTTDTLSGSAANCNVVCTNTAITACRTGSDGCCPSGCNANTDADCTAMCGNGVVEQGETCDGNCPAACDDGNACTADSANGSAQTCDLVCSNTPITACVNGDGCCPSGCNGVSDSDCGAVCGNGIKEGAELCDGNCPVSCNDGNSCTVDTRTGSSASCNVQCSYSNVTSCINGDGCCPASCNATNDNDCSATCGNGTVEGGELCDGNCPSANSCSACQTFSGSANTCDAKCTTDPSCTPCTLGGSCPCSADEVCSGGKCVDSGGNACGQACNANSYCSAHYGSSAPICSANTCVQCAEAAHCAAYEYCDVSAKTCAFPMECSGATQPNAWCVEVNDGDTCSNNVCRQSCSFKGQCNADEYCTGGFCEFAPSCELAKNPDAWCGAGYACEQVDGVWGCYQACNSSGDCPQYEACDATTNICFYPSDCEKSNDPAGWCVNEGLGDACDANGCFYSCQSDCDCAFDETCFRLSTVGACVLAAHCAETCSPNTFCQNYVGPNYACDTSFSSSQYGACCSGFDDCVYFQ